MITADTVTLTQVLNSDGGRHGNSSDDIREPILNLAEVEAAEQQRRAPTAAVAIPSGIQGIGPPTAEARKAAIRLVMGLSVRRSWSHPVGSAFGCMYTRRRREHPDLDQKRDHVAEIAVGDVQGRQQRPDSQGRQQRSPPRSPAPAASPEPGSDPVVHHHAEQQARTRRRNPQPPPRPPRTGPPAGENRSW